MARDFALKKVKLKISAVYLHRRKHDTRYMEVLKGMPIVQRQVDVYRLEKQEPTMLRKLREGAIRKHKYGVRSQESSFQALFLTIRSVSTINLPA